MTFILICLHGDWMLECMNEKTITYVEHAINFQRYAFCLLKEKRGSTCTCTNVLVFDDRKVIL